MDFITQYSLNKFQRTSTTFTKLTGQNISSGSVTSLGGAFILLSAISSEASAYKSRLRLYSDESSMITDADRTEGNYNLTASVALIADIVLTDSNKVTFTPPIIGNTFVGGQLWYNLSGSSAPIINVEVQAYPIRPNNDSTTGTTTPLVISGSSIPTTGYGVSGSITAPKSFLILSGSSTVVSRLRLYSRPYTEIPALEATRSFSGQAADDSLLIADLVFDSASFKYPLVPVLEAYTWDKDSYLVGSGQVGYILQNLSAGTSNITASLYIYSTED